MTITPQGKIYLCKTILTNDYKNSITWSNLEDQKNYFIDLSDKNFIDYTYMKENNTIYVDSNIDNIINYNYLMYQNTGFSNKWFYCFIKSMKYINEDCTEITIETDVLQTWYFEINYHQSFIEREHVLDDTIGNHTVPENLETGEYIQNSADYYSGLDDLSYVIQCTEWSTSDDKPLATNFGGIFMAGGAYVFKSMSEVVTTLQAFAESGKSDAIYNIYMVPSKFIIDADETAHYSGQNSIVSETFSVNKQSTLNGYTPHNNKLRCFPYNYLIMSNNNGSSNILHYERFNTNNCNFIIKGVPTVGGSIKCIPSNYDDLINNENEGLIAGKLPTLNWSDDAYTNWLTQNSVNISLGIASSGLTILGGIGMMSTGGGALAGAGSVISGAMSIANQLGQVYQHSLEPNSARGNVNGGDINVCDKKNGFFFYHTSIKKEYAKIIDKYFDMFGYKVNMIKTPQFNSRPYWNFIKTIDINITGNIPQDDLQIIKTCFDNGITWWHKTEHLLDYDQNNTI